MSQSETVQLATAAGSQFAPELRARASRGEISGAVAAIGNDRMSRMEAFGYRNQAARSPMELDTIFRAASMAKAVFTAAAMLLLDEGKFRLDDQVSKWAPELADRRVLRTPNSEIDDTVPALREITMFDVLSYQLGIGMYVGGHMSENGHIWNAMREAGVAPGPDPRQFSTDEFMSRLGTLPLAHQPGETFMYHTADDVLRVLISRISGQPLGEFLQERVFEPLQMVDSGLSVPVFKRHRFATAYQSQTNPGEDLVVWDEPDGRFAKDPGFPSSIVSTAGDYLNFTRMLLGKGMFQGRRFLSPDSVALMMTDHLTNKQKQLSPAPEGLWQNRGWGMGGTVYTRSTPHGPSAGSYSWFGGFGGYFVVDPKRGVAVILMVQRFVTGVQSEFEFELEASRDVLSCMPA